MKRIGYCRVSTEEQDVKNQTDYLKSLGAEIVLPEIQSGRKNDRPVLNKLLDELEEGDTLIVRHVDRLGRDALKLLQIRKLLQDRQVKLIAGGKEYDFTNYSDCLMFTIQAGMAEQESYLNGDRVRTAVEAKKRNRTYKKPKGRPIAISPRKQIEIWKAVHLEGFSLSSQANRYGVARGTVKKAYIAECVKRDVEPLLKPRTVNLEVA